MISEKKMKSCSVFHTKHKMEFEKFNCFFADFLRSSFGRIKVMSTVVEREYTPDIFALHINCFRPSLFRIFCVYNFVKALSPR